MTTSYTLRSRSFNPYYAVETKASTNASISPIPTYCPPSERREGRGREITTQTRHNGELRRVDIFTKDFVYLPIYQKKPWILIIIESLREPVTENGTASVYVLNPLTNYLKEPTEIRTYAQSFPAPFSNEKAYSPTINFDSTTNFPAETHFFEHVMTYILMILIHPS